MARLNENMLKNILKDLLLEKPPEGEEGKPPLTFRYINYKNEVSNRRVFPIDIWFGTTEWHKEPQWFLKAQDLDKHEARDFAMKDIIAWNV